MNTSWNKDDIKNLRRRLGWTQSDLARRLSCGASEIQNLEGGKLNPTQTMIHTLEMLESQAQQCSEEVHNLPVAEEACQKQALSQIDFNKISDDLDT